MNGDWKNFLAGRGLINDSTGPIDLKKLPDSSHPWICPVFGRGIIAFSGDDAAVFLQGQVTCDVDNVTEAQSSLGAYCNPKGRVITEFRLLKVDSAYYWLLSAELIPSVMKRLQMFILRSDVRVQDLTDSLCLIGISAPPREVLDSRSQKINYPSSNGSVVASGDSLIVKPCSFSDCLMLISPVEAAKRIWCESTDSNEFDEADSSNWERRVIHEGIPRIVKETSEKFTPQMLNLDRLDAISFKKGCYTGQEVVARTHYLGKLKRRMFLARCETDIRHQPNTPIFDFQDESDQSVGAIVDTSMDAHNVEVLLVVLNIANAESTQLRIDGRDGEKIEILSLPYPVSD